MAKKECVNPDGLELKEAMRKVVAMQNIKYTMRYIIERKY